MSLPRLLLAEGDFCVIKGDIADKLIRCGNGDSALLYLYVLRQGKHFDEKTAMRELGFSASRYEQAAFALSSLEIREQAAAPETKAKRSPAYLAAELRRARDGDRRFSAVCDTAESVLGQTLSEPQLRMLFTLYDHLGLPADVIIELLTYLKSEKGTLTRKDIQKEGYLWADLGLFTTADAAAYLRRKEAERPVITAMMHALGIEGREPSAEEYRYLSQFAYQGFSPEAVALAKERSTRKGRKFKWSYLGGVLSDWDQKGIHTVSEINALEPERGSAKPSPSASAPSDTIPDDKLSDWEKQWLDEVKARRGTQNKEDNNHGI